MRLVQLKRADERRIARVDGGKLRLFDARWPSIYRLALDALNTGRRLEDGADGSESLDYEPIYAGHPEWRLLPAFDHPADSAHCLVSGTGLTHKASAENRAAMHKDVNAALTDSAKMYQLGIDGGAPEQGKIGAQPEWFYKGDGSILRAHGEELCVPAYGWDGGEEPEIAGAYLIGLDGQPWRVGLAIGNEFSDHLMEKKNYLYLAPSKLRNCAIGPELSVGEAQFEDVEGTVSIVRGEKTIWTKRIHSGRKNMCHSLANLVHHHFKYSAHRRPGDAHIHFFGADAFSFGDALKLDAGDVMEIAFSGFGKALRNPLKMESRPESLVEVKVL